jgi:predicted enzyme related to lactoylglutathione lyase
MERVTGIGGFFFRSKDPKALAKWYSDHLGVNPSPGSPQDQPWRQEAGVTVFAPFKADTPYFGRPEQQWMINFRVANLGRMMAQLKAAGISVEMEAEDAIGRFARLVDPDGNPIQLWEPAP